MKIWQKFFVLLLFLPSSNFISLEEAHLELQALAAQIELDHPQDPKAEIAKCNRLIKKTELLLAKDRDGFPLYDFAKVEQETRHKKLQLSAYHMAQRLHLLKRETTRSAAILSELQQMRTQLSRWQSSLAQKQWQELYQDLEFVSAQLLLGTIRELATAELSYEQDEHLQGRLVSKLQEFVYNYPQHRDIAEVKSILSSL